MHRDLHTALVALRDTEWSQDARAEWAVVYSERGRHNGMSAESITVWFHRLYGSLGMDGCSSHSARRTFVTNAARKIVEAGGSTSRRAATRWPPVVTDDSGLH